MSKNEPKYVLIDEHVNFTMTGTKEEIEDYIQTSMGYGEKIEEVFIYEIKTEFGLETKYEWKEVNG